MNKNKKTTSIFKKPICIIIVLILSALTLVNCTNSPNQKKQGQLTNNSKDHKNTSLVRTFPSPPNRINNWIQQLATDSIRNHAWDIWEYITLTDSISGLPLWETWHRGQDLFNPALAKALPGIQRDFESPKQFFHTSVKPKTGNSIFEPLSFNRFSTSLFNTIMNKGYNKKSVLDSINTSFNNLNTPIVNREIQTSLDTIDPMSFALKPVFQFIDASKPAAIPYWAGVSTESTTNLTNPEPHTWRQCVIVDPTGKLKPGDTYTMSFNGEPAKEWPVISIEEFYHVKITKEEADNFSDFAVTSGDMVGKNNLTDSTSVASLVKKGNYALLVAMHVTGKEIKRWTWQTFWWSPKPENPVFGKDRPESLQQPWSNYNMRTAYYMVSPANTLIGGEPLISYNPYLETNLSGKVPSDNKDKKQIQWYGVFSNCMSCHRMAAYPNSSYFPDGFINPADSLKFSTNTKTDFLWSIPSRAK